MNSLKTRVTATILIGMFWLSFIVLYLAFWAGGLDFWQKTAVFIASGAIAIGLIALMWIQWAMK